MIDLERYLERIRWNAVTLEPTLDVLSALVRAHVENIPFENLDILLGREIRLDLPSLEDKLVRRRRGGYCFEQTTLFAAVLEQIGFTFAMHSARVVLNRPATEAPRTHMFLTVPCGGRTFVVDPGFGQAPRAPLPLEEGVVTRDGHEVHRLVRQEGEWQLVAGDDEARTTQWTSSVAHDRPIDFDVANHYTATYAKSPFVTNLMLRAWTTHDGDEQRRVGLLNDNVTIWHRGEPTRTLLEDRAALRAFVTKHLGFDLPEIEALRLPAVQAWA